MCLRVGESKYPVDWLEGISMRWSIREYAQPTPFSLEVEINIPSILILFLAIG